MTALALKVEHEEVHGVSTAEDMTAAWLGLSRGGPHIEVLWLKGLLKAHGNLDPTEVVALLGALHKEVDTDHDGRVNRAEWDRMVAQCLGNVFTAAVMARSTDAVIDSVVQEVMPSYATSPLDEAQKPTEPHPFDVESVTNLNQ